MMKVVEELKIPLKKTRKLSVLREPPSKSKIWSKQEDERRWFIFTKDFLSDIGGNNS